MTRLTQNELWNELYRRQSTAGTAGTKRIRRAVANALPSQLRDAARNYTGEVMYEQIYRRFIAKGPATKVLELGSAPGTHLAELHQRLGITPYGVDYSDNGVRLNREVFAAAGVPEDHSFLADIFASEFRQQHRECYDVVLSRGFIEHFEDVAEVVSVHLELLRPGGTLIVSVPNFRGLNFGVCVLLGVHEELKATHNLALMELANFRRAFDHPKLGMRLCDYLGTFSLDLFSGNDRTLAGRLVSSACYPAALLAVLERVVLGLNPPSFSYTSPSLVYVGQKVH